MNVSDRSSAEYYQWGNSCSGWHLLKYNDFSVIEECVPPGESEQQHFHHYSHQFFYILQGEAILEVDGNMFVLMAHQGIEVPPKVVHQFRNESSSDVRFLVVSVPNSHGDRVDT
jgi:mannose-6-phosphate isomerase-like protein (cupin superfamily)